MKKSIFISVLMFSLYILWRYSYGIFFKYFLVREKFANINMYWLELIESLFYLISIGIMVIFITKRKYDYKKIINISTLKLCTSVFLLAFLYRIVEDPLLRLYQLFGASFNNYSVYQSYSGIEKVVFGVNVVLLAPILEELIFRKGILDTFNNHNRIISIILSSLLFSAIHINFINFNYITIFSSFIFGSIACLIYLKFNLLTSIIFHITYNSIWYFLEFRKEDYFKILVDLDFNSTYWVIQISSFIAVVSSLYNIFQRKQ